MNSIWFWLFQLMDKSSAAHNFGNNTDDRFTDANTHENTPSWVKGVFLLNSPNDNNMMRTNNGSQTVH